MIFHPYPTLLGPEIKFEICNAPIGYAVSFWNHVRVYCTHGHMIRGKIYSNPDYADAVARRLNNWAIIARENGILR